MAVSHEELQQFSPFEKINDSQFEAISAYLRMENVAKGTFLIKRGKPLKAVTFLVDGRVDLVDASFNSETVEGGSSRSRKALTTQSPSDVAAQAKSEVTVLQVEHQAFEVLDRWTETVLPDYDSPPALEADTTEGGEDWMSSLLESPLFAQVPPAQLQQLFVSFEPFEAKPDEIIVEESAEGDYFYVIESGQAKVITRFDGEVATLGPGQFFGEEALVGDTIRNASVVMQTAGTLMRLNKENFKALLQEPLIRYIDGEELRKRAGQGQPYRLVDVRIPLEHRMAHVKDATNIPLASLRRRLSGLEDNTVYVVTDDGGKRSEVAAHLLCQAGFTTYILENATSYYGAE
ncbi:cyclic nucleotide-binding domain-containing protein [Gilvimarinus sp. F26214L]|uniref:cyclic nucleotide-binding domain-containing protein n=1 Tax=Gilvimarinus sp. DZF01 TaxID=3461371 RepID=UPI004045273C